FSSRRLHTRSKRDWSSDVCSSDLGLLCLVTIFIPSTITLFSFGNVLSIFPLFPLSFPEIMTTLSPLFMCILYTSYYNTSGANDRSEERRVGMECLCWWLW